MQQRACIRRSILVAAEHTEVRARIARLLRTASYSVELAENQKLALKLAARGDIAAAIVVHSAALAGLESKLRDSVPRTIVLGQPTDDILQHGPSLRGLDLLSVETLDDRKLLQWLDEPTASADHDTPPAPGILSIGRRDLDLADHTFVDGNDR